MRFGTPQYQIIKNSLYFLTITGEKNNLKQKFMIILLHIANLRINGYGFGKMIKKQ